MARIVIHRTKPDIGRRESDGQWLVRTDAGWTPINPPAWATGREVHSAHPMIDPYKRDEDELNMVEIRRVVTKLVPDYEAEVLVRNGWEYV